MCVCKWHKNSIELHLPAENLADAAMADSELSGNVAGPDSVVSQLHDPLPHHVGQGTTVHKHPAELVHAAVTCGLIGKGLLVNWEFVCGL